MPRTLNPERPRAFRWKGDRDRPSRAKLTTRDPDRFNRTKGMTLAQKMEHYTDKSGGPDACWPWRGPLASGNGPDNRYPQVCHKGKRMRATRVAMEIATGAPIPGGKDACHKCDNPPCVNPDHLFAGDDGDNARDRNAKGRAASKKGEANGRAKLTRKTVVEVRRLARSGVRASALSDRFGVSASQIRAVVRGTTWASVPDYLPTEMRHASA